MSLHDLKFMLPKHGKRSSAPGPKSIIGLSGMSLSKVRHILIAETVTGVSLIFWIAEPSVDAR